MLHLDNIDRHRFQRFVKQYCDRYGVFNETLYHLCRTHYGHGDRAVIAAKVLIVGRAMSATAERSIRGTRDNKATDLVLDHLYKNRRKLDDILGSLEGLQEELTVDGMYERIDLIVIPDAAPARMSTRKVANSRLQEAPKNGGGSHLPGACR